MQYDAITTQVESALAKTSHAIREDARQEAWVLILEQVRSGRTPDVRRAVRIGARIVVRARTLVPRPGRPADRRRNGETLPVLPSPVE